MSITGNNNQDSQSEPKPVAWITIDGEKIPLMPGGMSFIIVNDDTGEVSFSNKNPFDSNDKQ